MTVIEFPGRSTGDPVPVDVETADLRKGFPKIITEFPQPAKSRVAVGTKLRDALNRIGGWCEIIDTMRGTITPEQEALVIAQLKVVEGALFSIAYDDDPNNGGGKQVA